MNVLRMNNTELVDKTKTQLSVHRNVFPHNSSMRTLTNCAILSLLTPRRILKFEQYKNIHVIV